MRAVLFIIRFILAHDKTNAAFQFLSEEFFLKSSSIHLSTGLQSFLKVKVTVTLRQIILPHYK